MKKIIFTFVLFGALVAADNAFAQVPSRADKFKKEDIGVCGNIYTAPDKIVIGKKYNYNTIDQIFDAFKNHKEHKNDKSFTLANLKKWNSGKAIQTGTEVWLIEPKTKSGL